jgi:hypothetical protein
MMSPFLRLPAGGGAMGWVWGRLSLIQAIAWIDFSKRSDSEEIFLPRKHTEKHKNLSAKTYVVKFQLPWFSSVFFRGK